jgi:hypothetical protein
MKGGLIWSGLMGLGLRLGRSAHFQVCFAFQPKASAGILNEKESERGCAGLYPHDKNSGVRWRMRLRA